MIYGLLAIPLRGRSWLALASLLLALLGLSWLAASGRRPLEPQQAEAFPPVPRPATAFFPEPVRAELVSAVRAVLPQGWSIRRTQLGTTPTDWRSFEDRVGFLVEAGEGQEWLRVWFLPADWIAIRGVPNCRCLTCYWSGILKNERHTIITHASSEAHHHLCARLLNASTPSLVNSGPWRAERLFGYHSPRTDRIAAELVKRHCRTKAELGEAANSLIELGVPSRTVILRAIRELSPRDVDHGLGLDGVYGVLGQMGDPESVGALADQLRRYPSKYLAYALAHHRHPKVGPALHEALRKARDPEDTAAIAREIGLQHYHPAGPDLLAAYERTTNLYYAADVAHALAALRYREAIPAIQGACAKLGPDSRASFRDGGMHIALLRFTGDWGIPDRAARVHIAGPARVRAREPILLHVYVEVMGEEPMWTWHHVEFDLQVNGKKLVERQDLFMGGGLSVQYRPGQVMSLSCDLSSYLRRPGSYRVQYGDGKKPISSNAVTIEVLP
jgi:hypothetical protein